MKTDKPQGLEAIDTMCIHLGTNDLSVAQSVVAKLDLTCEITHSECHEIVTALLASTTDPKRCWRIADLIWHSWHGPYDEPFPGLWATR